MRERERERQSVRLAVVALNHTEVCYEDAR